MSQDHLSLSMDQVERQCKFTPGTADPGTEELYNSHNFCVTNIIQIVCAGL